MTEPNACVSEIGLGSAPMASHMTLDTFSDMMETLDRRRVARMRLAILSSNSPGMLKCSVGNARLGGVFIDARSWERAYAV